MSIENRIKALELAIQHKAVDTASNVITTAENFFGFITGQDKQPAAPQQAATTATSPTVTQPAAPIQTAASQSPPAAQTATTSVAPAVSYETHIAPKITAVAAVAKARIVELLSKFNAKRGPEVKEADYPTFLEQLTKLHDEVVKKAT